MIRIVEIALTNLRPVQVVMRAPTIGKKSFGLRQLGIALLLTLLLLTGTGTILLSYQMGAAQSEGTSSYNEGSTPFAVTPSNATITAGQTLTLPVLVNNSKSPFTWIVVHLTFYLLPATNQVSISDNLLPFVSDLPNDTVSSPFQLFIKGPQKFQGGSYLAVFLMSLRTSLLPPYQKASVAFNITLTVVNAPPPSQFSEGFLFWVGYLFASLGVMGVVVRTFVHRLG